MEQKTLLVDASFLLKRSYHGAKNLYNKFGHIGGLYQFMTKLRLLIKENKINKVILFWDGENGGLYRHNIDPAYKANRKYKKWSQIILSEYDIKKEKEKEESILKQRKRIQTYAEELYLRQIEVKNIEADDLIAYYCKEYHKKENIILYTNDRDFVQLLKFDIQIIFDNMNVLVDRNNFFLYFNYAFENSLTFKIICGDNSDNIKGIEGVKEKTLMKHFPDLKDRYVSVKEICQKAKIINEERVKSKKKPLMLLNNLLNNKERLKINHQLVNLDDPFLDDEALDELDQLNYPLSSENRGAKNLVKFMNEDEFLGIYGGSFVNYVEPFYSIIMNEKETLKKYKNSK